MQIIFSEIKIASNEPRLESRFERENKYDL